MIERRMLNFWVGHQLIEARMLNFWVERQLIEARMLSFWVERQLIEAQVLNFWIGVRRQLVWKLQGCRWKQKSWLLHCFSEGCC